MPATYSIPLSPALHVTPTRKRRPPQPVVPYSGRELVLELAIRELTPPPTPRKRARVKAVVDPPTPTSSEPATTTDSPVKYTKCKRCLNDKQQCTGGMPCDHCTRLGLPAVARNITLNCVCNRSVWKGRDWRAGTGDAELAVYIEVLPQPATLQEVREIALERFLRLYRKLVVHQANLWRSKKGVTGSTLSDDDNFFTQHQLKKFLKLHVNGDIKLRHEDGNDNGQWREADLHVSMVTNARSTQGQYLVRQCEAFMCSQYFGMLISDHHCTKPSHHGLPRLIMSTRRWQVRVGEEPVPFGVMSKFHDEGYGFGMESSIQHLHKFDLRCREDRSCWDAVCPSGLKRK